MFMAIRLKTLTQSRQFAIGVRLIRLLTSIMYKKTYIMNVEVTSLTLLYSYFKHFFDFVNDNCVMILVLDKVLMIRVEIFGPPLVKRL